MNWYQILVWKLKGIRYTRFGMFVRLYVFQTPWGRRRREQAWKRFVATMNTPEGKVAMRQACIEVLGEDPETDWR